MSAIVQTAYAGAGDAAAMNYLAGRGKVAGVAFVVPDDKSPISTFAAMRDALVLEHGAIASSSKPYPAGLTYSQLIDICDAWSAAALAGAQAAPQILSPTTSNNVLGEMNDVDAWRTLLGFYNYGAAFGASSPAQDSDIEQTFDVVLRLATQLEAIDFLTDDARPATWTWDEVPGTLAGAGLAELEGLLRSIVGGTLGAALASPLVWAAGLGFVAWKVLR